MVFSLTEALYKVNHCRLGLERVLFNRQSDYFFRRLANLSAQVEIVTNEQGEPQCCRTCGFVLATLTFPGGWSMETCSAFGLRGLLTNSKIPLWLEGFVSGGQDELVSYGGGIKLESQSVNSCHLPRMLRE